ncbi:MAG: efflux RND transporter periplasmic adaptor subunit [Desulfobacteraceae bacterium]|nr:efflux RND transporter periplasmic adaptor subunit [Desulfobacteraceae bacterium]
MAFQVRFFLLMFAFLMIVSCGDGEQNKVEKVIRPVKYMIVSSAKENKNRSFSGVSKAASTSRVSFRVSGKLESISVKEGDLIQKQALIASLDDSDAILQYEKAQAALDKSKVSMDTAKSNLSRIKSLYENNNVSLNEYEAAKEKLANSKASYMADKKNLDLKKKELGYFKVYASISGMISKISAEAGENVSAGQVILEVHTIDEMEVRAGIPDSYISKVKKNDQVIVSFSPLKNKKFDGKITEVSFNIDSDSTTYPVIIQIINPSDAIRPGMPATITFDFGSSNANDVLLIPVHSVGKDSNGHFVYLVKKTTDGLGVVGKKQVEIGRMTTNGFEALKGIKSGDMIVTAGISHLTGGLEVRMQ